MNKLTFINHACFLLEDENALFLCDPWFEGKAFNNGWSLIDESYDNEQIIKFLKHKNKKLFIWYSHEHSDHFATNFIKCATTNNLKFEVIYKDSLDQRVSNYFKKQNIKVHLVSKEKPIYNVSKNIIISAHAFSYSKKHTDDSFALIKFNNLAILNLNDCEVNTEEDLNFIKSRVKKDTNQIDIIFSQFGYAGFCEPNNKISDRKATADNVISRINRLINFFNPSIFIPFASFMYFSNSKNFFMNDVQNNPTTLVKKLENTQYFKKISLLLPMKDFNTDDDLYIKIMNDKENAIKYWSDKYNHKINSFNQNPINDQIKVNMNEILNSFNNFKKKILKNYYLYLYFFKCLLFCKNNMPKIYEYLIPKFLINIFKKDQSIIVKIDDLDKLYEFNYFESKEVYNKKPDISLDANDLKYCFDFEYGYNTLEVNCKAKIFNQKKMFNFFRFFYYLKDGFTQSKLISNKIALK